MYSKDRGKLWWHFIRGHVITEMVGVLGRWWARRIGKRSLVEDGSLRTDSQTSLQIRITWCDRRTNGSQGSSRLNPGNLWMFPYMAEETLLLSFRILRWGDDPGLCRWTLNVITSILVGREAEENLTYSREEGHVIKARRRDGNRERKGHGMSQRPQQIGSRPPALVRVPFFTQSMDSNANFFQKHPHRHP